MDLPLRASRSGAIVRACGCQWRVATARGGRARACAGGSATEVIDKPVRKSMHSEMAQKRGTQGDFDRCDKHAGLDSEAARV